MMTIQSHFCLSAANQFPTEGGGRCPTNGPPETPMHLRTALRKSSVIAPIEAALRACKTEDDLQDAWYDYADSFADETPEREALLGVFLECATLIGLAKAGYRPASEW